MTDPDMTEAELAAERLRLRAEIARLQSQLADLDRGAAPPPRPGWPIRRCGAQDLVQRAP